MDAIHPENHPPLNPDRKHRPALAGGRQPGAGA